MSQRRDRANKSLVWTYFEEMGDSARCKRCNKVLRRSSGSTSALRAHLRTHDITLQPASSYSDENNNHATTSQGVQQTMEQFIKRESVEEVFAKLVAVDGFSMHSLVKSEFIRRAMTDRGFQMPKNPSTVTAMIQKQAGKIREELKESLQAILKDGGRFSCSFDEWTSLRNRRYLGIILHGNNKYWRLALIRVRGKVTAEVLEDEVKKKLLQFGITMEKHIIACITDGASVNVKFGRNSPTEHQLCLAHGLHIAVCSALYKKEPSRPLHDTGEEEEDGDEDEEEEEEEEEEEGETTGEHGEDLQSAIKKVRKCVSFFRRSPAKNEVLQK